MVVVVGMTFPHDLLKSENPALRLTERSGRAEALGSSRL